MLPHNNTKYWSSSLLSSKDSIQLFTVKLSQEKTPVCIEYFSIFLEMISFLITLSGGETLFIITQVKGKL